MKIMAELIRRGRLAEEVMKANAAQGTTRATGETKVGRNDPSPYRSEK